MVRWLLSATAEGLGALEKRQTDVFVADRLLAGLCRSKEILKIYDTWFGKFAGSRITAFDALVQLNALPE